MLWRVLVNGLSASSFFFASTAQADVSLKVRDGYAPFADPGWSAGGMASEIVTSAMAQSPDPLSLTFQWVGPAVPALPRVASHQVDMAFPVPPPFCDDISGQSACDDFSLSDPLLELIWLLFVRVENQFPFESADDLSGRTICLEQPAILGGEASGDRLNLPGLPVKVVTQPRLSECFALAMRGEVDAVAVEEFRGVAQLFDLQLTDAMVPLPRVLAKQPLHIVVSRSHWRGTALLYRFNAGLARLRETGACEAIVSRHVDLFWKNVKR